jgi:curved DNA-binding protein CbpA
MTDPSRQPKADYYHLLQVSTEATKDDVKKAFRQLAFQFHPDHNTNASAAIYFAQLKEAYECLSDNERRAKYDRERQLNPLYRHAVSFTPEALLFRFRELEQKMRHIHPDRIDRDGLYAEFSLLFSPFHLNMLREQADLAIKQAIVQITLQLALPLEGAGFSRTMEHIQSLAEEQPSLQKEIRKYIQEHRLFQYWSRYKIPIALLIAALLCAGIFMVSR